MRVLLRVLGALLLATLCVFGTTPASWAEPVRLEAELECTADSDGSPVGTSAASGGGFVSISGAATWACTLNVPEAATLRMHAYAGGGTRWAGQWALSGSATTSFASYAAPADHSPNGYGHTYFDVEVPAGRLTVTLRTESPGLYLDYFSLTSPEPPPTDPTDPPTTEPTTEPTSEPTPSEPTASPSSEPTGTPSDPPTSAEPPDPPPTSEPPPSDPDAPQTVRLADGQWFQVELALAVVVFFSGASFLYSMRGRND